MCSINGVLLPPGFPREFAEKMSRDLVRLIDHATDRGRDSCGYIADGGAFVHRQLGRAKFGDPSEEFANVTEFVLNTNRAEPTTEYISQKALTDIPPFKAGMWVVAHNGTIANDEELKATYGLDVPTRIDTAVVAALLQRRFPIDYSAREVIEFLMNTLVGSYALAIAHASRPHELILMCNYKPLAIAAAPEGYLLFSSLPEYFHTKYGISSVAGKLDPHLRIAEMKPYTALHVSWNAYLAKWSFDEVSIRKIDLGKRALVVCSGGLDSTVVAALAQRAGYDVTLCHFLYECRAQIRERAAIEKIADRLGCDHVFIPTDIFKNVIGGSTLTSDTAASIAQNESGAEYAHEWVPARNLIMLSIAVGYAESHGYDTIMLGNNLEESGAYPDNEMAFINKLNDVLPYAVQANKSVEIRMPVGNLMKWEIVKLGLDIGAPLDLCWSCYRAGEKHCGTCGPCFMRRTAFKINHTPDVLEYASDDR